jgi:hypothetical protein
LNKPLAYQVYPKFQNRYGNENRYPDVVKRDKVPYQGSFEEIAVSEERELYQFFKVRLQLSSLLPLLASVVII